jgi:hypothetical protein
MRMMSILTSPSPLLPALSIHMLLTFHLLLLPSLHSLYIIVITGPAKDCSWSVQESHPACTGGAAVYPQYRGAFRWSDDQGV